MKMKWYGSWKNGEEKCNDSYIRWFLKMWVLRPCLKASTDGDSLKLRGSWFQSLGAENLRAVLPTRLREFITTSLVVSEADLRALPGTYLVKRSLRYCGASPLRHLKTNTRHLKCTLQRTGSQCKSINIGVMWQDLGRRTMTRAAAFCSFCSRLTCVWQRPINTEEQ